MKFQIQTCTAITSTSPSVSWCVNVFFTKNLTAF